VIPLSPARSAGAPKVHYFAVHLEGDRQPATDRRRTIVLGNIKDARIKGVRNITSLTYGRQSFGAFFDFALLGGHTQNSTTRNINNNLAAGGLETAVAGDTLGRLHWLEVVVRSGSTHDKAWTQKGAGFGASRARRRLLSGARLVRSRPQAGGVLDSMRDGKGVHIRTAPSVLLATELADEGVKGRRQEKAKAGYAQHPEQHRCT
jgi:hypothetical protein